MTIEQRIQANESGLNRLFGKYNIKARGLDGIREGAERFGAIFVGRAADELNNNPKSVSNFEEDPDFIGPPTFDYDSAPEAKKNIWDSLNNILDFANAAGETYGNIRKNVSGNIEFDYDLDPKPEGSTNWLLIGAGVAVLAILFLIFKK